MRAFYSTTEAITALFSKQQLQLKAMQRALEDDDDYDDPPPAMAPAPLQQQHTTNSCGAAAGDACTQDLDCPSVDGGGGAAAGEVVETEHVPETESPGENGLCGNDTAREKIVGTADLFASEELSSWADCNAPSGHGENDFPSNDCGVTAMSDEETEEGDDGGSSEDDTERSVGEDDHVVVEDSMG